jgi:hypothetical protein
MYASSVASDMRCLSFGYSASLDRKKQYVQSMLHVDPLGFARRWKRGGAPVADVGIGMGCAITDLAGEERASGSDERPFRKSGKGGASDIRRRPARR